MKLYVCARGEMDAGNSLPEAAFRTLGKAFEYARALGYVVHEAQAVADRHIYNYVQHPDQWERRKKWMTISMLDTKEHLVLGGIVISYI